MTTPEMAGESGRTAGSRLGWLIAGRLVTALLLSVFGTIWTRAGNSQQSIDKSLVLLTIVAGVTIVYAIVFRLSKNILAQARFQLAVDALLVTWLVWSTQVIQSPYIALYIVIIALSSLFLGPRGALITSVACAVAFTACALAITGIFGATTPTNLIGGSLSQTVQWVGLFDVAFFVVGLLSARLAERRLRTDVRLQAAKQSLANLRALHERIVESIRSGVVTTDLAGRIYTFNAAAEEITGYREETIRGQDASLLFGELKDQIAESLRALQTGETSPRFEASCNTADGMRARLGFSISPLSTESGETTGMVITFQDLTQVRTLEET
jgi:two-component system sensor histidine kinase PilS (NtrC family)